MPSQPKRFPTTRWTLILNLQEPETPQRERALAELCELYWYPVYGHLRHLGRTPEDSEDLTQEFFEHIILNDTFDRAEQSRGRLRSYLLGALQRFVSKDTRKRQAVKRGGGISHLSLDRIIDSKDGETRYQFEAVDDDNPEKIFYRRWAQTLIDSVQTSLREEYEARGNVEQFDALQPYLFGNAGEAKYDQPAESLGISVEAVRTAVKRLRQRFRESLRNQIRFTLDDPSEIDGEIRELLAILQR